MEKYKILIIEDDPRQITWAKECLKNHELIFLNSFEEYQQFDKKKKEEMHIVITDLFLPRKTGEENTEALGHLIFSKQLELLQHKRYFKFFNPNFWLAKINLFGLALLSDYEHHIDGYKGSDVLGKLYALTFYTGIAHIFLTLISQEY